MRLAETIDDAGARFIQAVFRAKERARTRDEFWEDKQASKAYSRLVQAIGRAVPSDVKWQTTTWEIVGSTSERIWEEDLDENTITQGFCRVVHECLDDLAAADWIASVPMEHVFSNFPEVTTFGEFALVNPNAGGRPPGTVLDRFRSILTTRFGVNFMPETEVHDSYLRLGDHYRQKSGGYIPGRPQMIVKVARGETYSNERLLQGVVATHFALLALCQMVYEQLESGLETMFISPGHDRLPSGESMPSGLIQIPRVAVAINARTGQANWWSTGPRLYETQAGIGYKPDKFEAIWKDLAVPIVVLRNAGLSGMVREAIDNAIALMAKCRHLEMGDLTLYSVIATETILNPFNAFGDSSERFAIFAAVLTESTQAKRLEAYQAARGLYRFRNLAVHQSRLHGDRDERETRTQAFRLFLGCLKAITRWATDRLAVGGECGMEEFKDLYTNQVFSI